MTNVRCKTIFFFANYVENVLKNHKNTNILYRRKKCNFILDKKNLVPIIERQNYSKGVIWTF